MNFLFWNVRDNVTPVTLTHLALETRADILILAEYGSELRPLLEELAAQGLDFFELPNVGCPRIKIVTKFSPDDFNIGPESEYYTIRELTKAGCEPILLACVHLPGKGYKADAETDQLLETTYFRQEIEAAERETGNENTVILGDFNMNPYEKGMLAAPAMHSLPSLQYASSESRIVKDREHSFFYNPCWSLFGDLDDLPGTYFYQSSSYVAPYWHVFDQVILRPGIASRFSKTSLRIVTSAGGQSFLNDLGRPGLSDHLPLFFTLNIEHESAHAESLA